VGRIVKVGPYQTAEDIRTAIIEYTNKDPPAETEHVLQVLSVTGKWWKTDSLGDNNDDLAALHVVCMSKWPGSITNKALFSVLETWKSHDLPMIGYYTHAVANELNKWRETLECLKALLAQQEAFERECQTKPTGD
jgi:hypothetical protein